MQWLVQLFALTLIENLNIRWQDCKIRQFIWEGGERYVNLLGNIHRSTILFDSSQKLINQN